MTISIKEGQLAAGGNRFGIIVSKFNETVTSQMLKGAIATLKDAGAREEEIEIVKVPGAFEIPLIARQLAQSQRFDAIICIGAVIRGETPHFDFISAEASRGIAQAGLDTGIPVIFGVLTTDTVEQALARANDSGINRGAEAAQSAMEMASLMKQLHHSGRNRPGFQGAGHIGHLPS